MAKNRNFNNSNINNNNGFNNNNNINDYNNNDDFNNDNDFNSIESVSHLRCRLDIINMPWVENPSQQEQVTRGPPMNPNEDEEDRRQEYKHILIYEDNATNFLCLKPLRKSTPSAVSSALIDIFCELGSTLIISTHNHTITNQIIREMKEQWPQCFLLLGNSLSVKELTRFQKRRDEVSQRLQHWCEEQGTQMWSHGLRFVQYQLNSDEKRFNNSEEYLRSLHGNRQHERSMLSLSSQLSFDAVTAVKTEDDLVNAVIAHS